MLAVKDIGGHGKRVLAIGRQLKAFGRPGFQFLVPHNPAHFVTADLMAVVAQVFNHSPGSATAPVLVKYFFKLER